MSELRVGDIIEHTKCSSVKTGKCNRLGGVGVVTAVEKYTFRVKWMFGVTTTIEEDGFDIEDLAKGEVVVRA